MFLTAEVITFSEGDQKSSIAQKFWSMAVDVFWGQFWRIRFFDLFVVEIKFSFILQCLRMVFRAKVLPI